MKRQYVFLSFFFVSIIFAALMSGCKDPLGINNPRSVNSSDTQKFMKIADKSSSVNSFTPNYTDDQAMALAGSLAKELYPIRIGQKMKLVDKSLILSKDSTSALGTLIQNYAGELTIEGSFQKPTLGINARVDTTIHKTFLTTVTRMIKYNKVSNTGNDTLDWKIYAISLPNGGTDGDNIQIVKMTFTSQDGSDVVIDDPNNYFFQVGDEKMENDDKDNHDSEMGFGNWRHGEKNLLTWYKKNQPVKFSVEVLSKSSDPDLLTITYGAKMHGNSKLKAKFDLVSSVQEGIYYKKVYERKWFTNSFQARMHAVINAMPRSVAYDTETSVEEKTWGIPYRVK